MSFILRSVPQAADILMSVVAMDSAKAKYDTGINKVCHSTHLISAKASSTSSSSSAAFALAWRNYSPRSIYSSKVL
jgi:hypothetical protein